MPLGKIIKLITGGFQKRTSEPANILKLSEVEKSIVEEPVVVKSTSLIPIESDNTTFAMVDKPLLRSIATDNSFSSTFSTTTSSVDTPLPIISQGKNMINISMLQEELQSFVSGASDVQGAALVTPDGLELASVLPGGMDEERTAAMSASMLSLGERIGRELARGVVERIVVEGEKGYGVLVSCGSDAVLLVLAGTGVKQGILFLEVKRVVAKLAPLLG
ncbi:roadblock/LC7 domain-containing protein [Brunnivagina elsteri]|uniref:Roadblock/LAMTOR2 domain-containing protein n=1 Tax=Brunnivagina elsteri CCALA 953 TaxID=987040 RepID=A0A2A2T9V9_9CYAN|nr:hypothetical protein CK510_30050 [Calothrix elsteri CCALA 953]